MLNFMALYLAPRLEKGYHGIWEANFKTLGANVSAFINILMSMCKHLLVTWGETPPSKKCPKLAPSFLGRNS
jgi:hypothetical protein